MAFSHTLRNLLLDRNMKAVELARKTGLSEAAISDYLNGKKEPRGKQSIAIAKALNVSLDVLWETEFADKKKPTTAPDDELSASDLKLIQLFHLVPEEQRQYVLGLIEAALKSQGLL